MNTYENFQMGNIPYPSKAYIGQTLKMACGLYAKIVKIRGAKDIDILFEDGMLVQHKSYHFKHYSIKYPGALRENETLKMKCGQMATIVRYNTALDIDVRLEDGTLYEHRIYDSFKSGTIGSEKKKREGKKGPRTAFRIGDRKCMKNGLWAEIIGYQRVDDIDIKFDNGIIVRHKAYSNFKNGNIGCPLENFEPIIDTTIPNECDNQYEDDYFER